MTHRIALTERGRRMCVVSHGCGGLDWAGMEVVDGENAGQSEGGCKH